MKQDINLTTRTLPEELDRNNSAHLKVMKGEAYRMMKLMGFSDERQKKFLNDDEVWIDEPPFYATFELEDEVKKYMQDIERRFGGLVFGAILSRTTIGNMISFLWVSKYKNDWKINRDSIKNNTVFAWVWNTNDDMLSEFGSIRFQKMPSGGFKRGY